VQIGKLLLRNHVLKLRSDQTDSVSVDLHQQRLNGDGRLLSFGRTCGRLRSAKNQKPPFKDPETPAAVGHERSYVDVPDSGQ
jgi:hypothetical protein